MKDAENGISGATLDLALILFLVFQAVFAWAEAPMTLIKTTTAGRQVRPLTMELPS